MKQESLTSADFDRLLWWLDSNPEQAAIKYEKTRVRLITFFVGGDCGCDAERLADEAFDRVSQKLKAGEVSESDDRNKTFYFLGFAKNIRLEYLRRRKSVEVPTEIKSAEGNMNGHAREVEFDCLDQCMNRLTKENRSLVTEYYLFEKSAKIQHRRKIANQLGIDVNALRIRVYRLREQLKPCIESCLERSELAS